MERSSALLKGGTAIVVSLTAFGSLFAAGASAQTHPARGKAAAHAKTRYVSPRGKDSSSCTRAEPCKTITDAIAKSHAGGTVMVGPGTYREDVKVAKKITLAGRGHPVIEARGLDNGIVVTGARAKGAVVQGFTVRNATFEGIQVRTTTGVTIRDNTVTHNDRGLDAARRTGFCSMRGGGDCGEAVHFIGATHSKAIGNTVTGNAGGILLTDEFGPTAFNTIAHNKSVGNMFDCGIVLAGHNPGAIMLGGGPGGPPVEMGRARNVAGVYNNLIEDNTVDRDGLKSDEGGGGIMLATPLPGGGVYDNTVKGNTAEGDGFAGITLHSHTAGQDLNGNKIIDNTLIHDGVLGNPRARTPGDADAGITETVGITVFSAVTPLQGIVVKGNRITNEHFGVWTQNVPTFDASANRTTPSVAVPLFQK